MQTTALGYTHAPPPRHCLYSNSKSKPFFIMLNVEKIIILDLNKYSIKTKDNICINIIYITHNTLFHFVMLM